MYTPLRQWRQSGGNLDPFDWSFEADHVYRGGGLLAAVTPQGTRHFHLDHLGTPRIVTDASGTTLAYHAYYPYGEEVTSVTDSVVNLQYTGHERDDLDKGADTLGDLDYMHARYFNSTVGRFMSIDPLGDSAQARLPQSWNRYSYAQGNPMKYIDPTGEIISLASLSDTDITKLLEDLNAFTGNEYGIDENKNLVLLALGEDRSKTATDFLDELMGPGKTFTVVSSQKNSGHFETGEVELNFSTFEGAVYGDVNPSAYNLGSNLIHELTHASSPVYDTLDGTLEGVMRTTPDWTGPVVDSVNQMRAERGFPQRAHYVGIPKRGQRTKVGFTDVNPKRPDRVYYVVRKRFD